MYTLTKLSLKEGQVSAVKTKQGEHGPNLTVFKLNKAHTDIAYKLDNPKLKSIKAGYQVLVSSASRFLRTSAIAKVISCTENKIIFETQTSVYELTKD